MTGYWLLVCHRVGDYVLQSDWMASEKTKGWRPAVAHATVYTLPFMLLFGFQWEPLLLIGGTHLIIDHYRLARYICWAKNIISPKRTVTFTPDPNGPWHESPVDGCMVDDKGIYTCTHHPEKRAVRQETKWRHPWSECSGTGYQEDKPLWLTLWLMIITDNAMHLAINGIAWEMWGAG